MWQLWSATQDSRNALNWSRTGKKPFFNLFIQISGRIWLLWLLFAHQLPQRNVAFARRVEKGRWRTAMWMCYLQITISLAPHHTNVCKFSQPCRAIIIFSRYRCITFKFGNFQMLRRSFQYCQRTYPNLSMSKDEKTVKRSIHIIFQFASGNPASCALNGSLSTLL